MLSNVILKNRGIMSASNSNMDFKLKIEQINELPSLPSITKQLLLLQKNSDSTTKELVKILELDPVLSAQILKYSNSAFFNRAKRIESLNDATSVIGFEIALNYAIAVTSASQFSIPMTGPIGMRSFWKHAIYSAHLMQKLASKIPIQEKPISGLAYLSGLLHNIGFVLLGHTFPNEFDELNNALANSKPGNVSSIELKLLGVHHYELSIWLMRKWGLPKEIMTAVFEHHNENYKGINWQYANLTLLVDRLLFNYDLGDAENGELPQRILDVLDLDSNTVMECTESLLTEKTNINGMIEAILSSSKD